jgi:hypothetical protein
MEVEIMFIEANIGGGTSSGGIGNVPIRVESLRRPTPTFLYIGGFLAMKGMLLVSVSELKKASWSTVTTFP